jgi:hypothetical protein
MTDVIYKSVDDVTIRKTSVFTLKVFFGFFKFSNTLLFILNSVISHLTLTLNILQYIFDKI